MRVFTISEPSSLREQWRVGLEPLPPWLPAQNKPLPIFLVFKLQSGLTRNCSSRRHVHCHRLPVCTDVARSIRARSVRSLVAHDLIESWYSSCERPEAVFCA